MPLTKLEKCVITLLSYFKKPISKIKLVKMMFLLTEELKHNDESRVYTFVPYKYGPFSFQLYRDLNHIEQEGMINQTERSIELIKSKNYNLYHNEMNIIKEIANKFGDMSESKILKYVYSKYPHYKIYNEFKNRKISDQYEPEILSIGYEGRSIDDFLFQLINNKIDMVVDVRNNPFSMKYGFSKKILTEILNNFNIKYQHFPELGIPSNFRKNLVTNEDYKKLFFNYNLELENKLDILKELKNLSQNYKLAIFCFERDKNFCHRSVIAQKLQNWGIKVNEI